MSDESPIEWIGQGQSVRYGKPHPELGFVEGTGTVSHEFYVDDDPTRHGVQIASDLGFSVAVDLSESGAFVDPI